MGRKQLITLFLVGVVGYSLGNGLIPLLPVYARNLGATPELVGYYLSICYASIAAGTIAGGWLADRLDRRKVLLVAAGVVASPALGLMGMVSDIWMLTALTALVWFSFGLGGTQISILAGLSAREAERGKVFGILGVTAGLGSLIGGLSIGFLADVLGYPAMLLALAIACVLWPLIALLTEDRRVSVTDSGAPEAKDDRRLPGSLYLLLVSSTVVFVAHFGQLLARSLAMNDLGFGATAISSTTAIVGATTMPLPVVLGVLSDRFGRKGALTLSYVIAVVGLLVLAQATAFWHFAVTASLLAVLPASNAVGSALTRDLVPRESVGRGMAAFNATRWVGGVLGFASAGRAVQSVGMTTTFVLAGLLPVLAIALLTPIRETQRGVPERRRAG